MTLRNAAVTKMLHYESISGNKILPNCKSKACRIVVLSMVVAH